MNLSESTKKIKESVEEIKKITDGFDAVENSIQSVSKAVEEGGTPSLHVPHAPSSSS